MAALKHIAVIARLRQAEQPSGIARIATVRAAIGRLMDLGQFCAFAARENMRLRWSGRFNAARTNYRIRLEVVVAEHIRHTWRDCFPIDQPLDDALNFMASKYRPFYAGLIERHRLSSSPRVLEAVE